MTAFIDCGSGIAGDMLIGALVDLGLSSVQLERMLHQAIPVKGWRLKVSAVERQGWPAKALSVVGDRPFGPPERMAEAIRRARLPSIVRKNALEVIARLSWAEAQAHGTRRGSFDDNGLALLDTLIDTLGACWGFWRLGLSSVTASPVNTGRIAPATAQLLKKFSIPAYSTHTQYELATPTGAALLSVLVRDFGAMPVTCLSQSGYGAGAHDPAGKPNILALHLQGSRSTGNTWTPDQILLLETVIDDMDPRLYPHVSDLLFQAGALDVWWISAGMKKGRPGIAFSVICPPKLEDAMLKILFIETTTLGVRRQVLDRWVLPRRAGGLEKIAQLPAGRKKRKTEFEIARRIAAKDAVALKKLLK